MPSDLLPSQLSAHIAQLEEQAVQAFRNHDTRVMDELHDIQCLGVGLLGTQYSKSEFIQTFSTSLKVNALELLSVNSVVEDDFAIALSNWDVNLSLGPAVFDGRVRVTRTWVKRSDSWKIISFHFSDARLATTWERLRSVK